MISPSLFLLLSVFLPYSLFSLSPPFLAFQFSFPSLLLPPPSFPLFSFFTYLFPFYIYLRLIFSLSPSPLPPPPYSLSLSLSLFIVSGSKCRSITGWQPPVRHKIKYWIFSSKSTVNPFETPLLPCCDSILSLTLGEMTLLLLETTPCLLCYWSLSILFSIFSAFVTCFQTRLMEIKVKHFVFLVWVPQKKCKFVHSSIYI
jgi:hypothetical protein